MGMPISRRVCCHRAHRWHANAFALRVERVGERLDEGEAGVGRAADEIDVGALRLDRFAGEDRVGIRIDLDGALALVGILQELHVADLAALRRLP